MKATQLISDLQKLIELHPGKDFEVIGLDRDGDYAEMEIKRVTVESLAGIAGATEDRIFLSLEEKI